MRAFSNIDFFFFRTGRIRKRRKKSLTGLTGEIDVIVCSQGRFPNLAAAFSEGGLFLISNFFFRKRRKQSLVGDTDVVVRLQRCFPNLAEAFSESDYGVFRMRVLVILNFFAPAKSGNHRRRV